jgi:hypothetical protein
MTPKITRLPSPYKLKSASAFKKPNSTPGPRPSFKIIERLSLAPLPNGMTSRDDWTDEEDVQGVISNEEERGECDGNSVTLREILLQAGDSTRFDLLGLLFPSSFSYAFFSYADAPEIDDADGFDLADASTAWE